MSLEHHLNNYNTTNLPSAEKHSQESKTLSTLLILKKQSYMCKNRACGDSHIHLIKKLQRFRGRHEKPLMDIWSTSLLILLCDPAPGPHIILFVVFNHVKSQKRHRTLYRFGGNESVPEYWFYCRFAMYSEQEQNFTVGHNTKRLQQGSKIMISKTLQSVLLPFLAQWLIHALQSEPIIHEDRYDFHWNCKSSIRMNKWNLFQTLYTFAWFSQKIYPHNLMQLFGTSPPG